MTTTPTASPELLDLDKLEALARAATPGEWKALPHGRVVGGPLRHYVNGSAKAQIASFGVTFHEQAPEDEPERQQANADFAAAANPEQVLALIALARRAQPEGEAPQAEPEPMNTQSSRQYLVEFMEKHFTDKTYHRYIRGEATRNGLAGDFAWQMARALRMLAAAPGNPPEIPDGSTSATGAPEAPQKPAHGHRDDYYLLANGRRLGLEPISRVRNMPNWVLAMELFATGSTSAHQICHDAGIDPDSTTIQRTAQLDGGQEGSESNG